MSYKGLYKFIVPALLMLFITSAAIAQVGNRRGDIRKWTRLLRSEDPQERSSAATNLLSTNDSAALSVLIETMGKDVPEKFRISVITAFGIKGDDRACSQIIAALNDPSEAVRQAAYEALQGISSMDAIQRLQQASRETGQPVLVRTQAIAILGEMRVIDAIPALIDLLSDSNDSVRSATGSALKRITLRSFATAKEWSAWWEPNSKLSREEILEDLVNLQYERIRHLNESNERLHLTVLSERNDKTDPSPLITAFDETESSRVKLYAIRELALLKSPQATGTLIRAIADADPAVRLGAAEALGALGEVSAAEPLAAALMDSSSLVRAAAAKSLGTLKWKAAAPVLCELLADPAEEVAVAAANALGEIGDPIALDYLIKIVTTDKESPALYEASAGALARMNDLRAVPGLIDLLRSDKDKLRWSAVDALGNLRAIDAIEPLKGLAVNDGNPQIREAALAALSKIGDASALDAMLLALNDREKRVADQARRSLIFLAEKDTSVYGKSIDRLLMEGMYDSAESIVAAGLETYLKSNANGEGDALRKRMAQGLLGVRQWSRAKPYLDAILLNSPKDQSALKDMALCLSGLADYDSLLSLYSRARQAQPADSLYWWQETARTLEQLSSNGQAERVITAVAALETEDATLGGPAVAPKIQEIRRKARESLAAAAPAEPRNNP